MAERIEQQRLRFEQSLNSGNLEAALQALDTLKKANCDIRLTLRPEARSFRNEVDECVRYLERLGLNHHQAAEIAEHAPAPEAAYQLAVQRGLLQQQL